MYKEISYWKMSYFSNRLHEIFNMDSFLFLGVDFLRERREKGELLSQTQREDDWDGFWPSLQGFFVIFFESSAKKFYIF